jgi:glycosyltransferase involved in cell wall biosynthesis
MDHKMTLNTVSVVIPTYNDVNTICATLDSILNQTQKPDEIIVVDDCGSIDLKNLLGEERLSQIQLLRHEVNQGGCVARNTGLKVMTSDAVMFVDGDDRVFPDFIESCLKILNRNPETAAVFTAYHAAYEEDIPNIDVNNFNAEKGIEIYGPEERLAEYLNATGLCLPSFCMLRMGMLSDMMNEGNLYNSSIRTTGDFEFFVRLLLKKSTVFTPEYGGIWLLRPGSLSHNQAAMWENSAFSIDTILSSSQLDGISNESMLAMKLARRSYTRKKAKSLVAKGHRAEALKTLLSESMAHLDFKTIGLYVVTLLNLNKPKSEEEDGYWRNSKIN